MPPPPLRHVKQATASSCGLACVAMLAAVPLSRVRAILASRLRGYPDDTTNTADIRFALARLGIRMGRAIRTHNWRRLARLHSRALAAVRFKRHRSGHESWHWVIFDGEGSEATVWDPFRNKNRARRTDLGSIPLAWYHPVSYKS